MRYGEVNDVFRMILREIITVSLHRAVIESLASENAARLAAMHAAEGNLMEQAWFRVYGALNDFLPPPRRQRSLRRRIQPGQTVKDAAEALGVPHPEIGLILADGVPVGFDHRVRPDERISVYPPFRRLDVSGLRRLAPPPPQPARFVLDGHLGRLAVYLRLLGFDTLYQRDRDDEELARLAAAEGRILLSRDRGLLKRREVVHGYLPRSDDPRQQMLEVAERYDLGSQLNPWRCCPRCNGPVEAVGKAAVAALLPQHTRRSYSSFGRCRDCRRVYWKGAHARWIEALIDAVREQQRRQDALEGVTVPADPAKPPSAV